VEINTLPVLFLFISGLGLGWVPGGFLLLLWHSIENSMAFPLFLTIVSPSSFFLTSQFVVVPSALFNHSYPVSLLQPEILPARIYSELPHCVVPGPLFGAAGVHGPGFQLPWVASLALLPAPPARGFVSTVYASFYVACASFHKRLWWIRDAGLAETTQTWDARAGERSVGAE
jgi:hypothetical protein